MPLFGTVHILLLIAIVAAAVILPWLSGRKSISPTFLRVVLGVGLVVNELIWWSFRYGHEGIHLTNLPLQLCDVTVWATVVACLARIPLAVEFAYFTGFAGSGMALLTPDLWSPWPSYPAIYFFLAHGGIVVACAVLVFGKAAAIRAGAVWRAFGVVLVYAAAVGTFDALAGADYMYLRRKPANPSVLDWFGPWPFYLIGGAVAALVLFWILSIPLRFTRQPASEQPASSGRHP